MPPTTEQATQAAMLWALCALIFGAVLVTTVPMPFWMAAAAIALPACGVLIHGVDLAATRWHRGS